MFFFIEVFKYFETFVYYTIFVTVIAILFSTIPVYSDNSRTVAESPTNPRKKLKFYSEPLHTYKAQSLKGSSYQVVDLNNQSEHISYLIHHPLKKCAKSLKSRLCQTQVKKEQNKEDFEIHPPIPLNIMEGCEVDGEAMQEMIARHPKAPTMDLQRFLIARNADIEAASSMYLVAEKWRAENLPARKSRIGNAIQTNCVFVGKPALDGTPTMYCRAAFYDNTKAKYDEFVVAAAHCMDYALKKYKANSLTVVCNLTYIPGETNQHPDVQFIKQFAKVIMDVYPERLRKFIVYPFAWYGRPIWAIVSVFLNKRTRDKIVLLEGDYWSMVPPEDLFLHLEKTKVPIACGGTDPSPIPNMYKTLKL